ncbi:MAG: HupE/UreJ family protein [Comamonadaceae bacterium]|nr:MAG: HupE/UreJ family protein [Comamonadaceae bacterium]
MASLGRIRSRLADILVIVATFAVLLLASAPAAAHKASDAYLQLQRRGEQILLRWDIALRDLDAALDLDADADQRLSWGEVRARLPDIRAYALARLKLDPARCGWNEASPPALERRVDGTYLVLQLRSDCPADLPLKLDYGLFRDIDPTHRGLLRIDLGDTSAPLLRSLDPGAGAIAIDTPAARATPVTGGPVDPGRTAAPARRGELFKDGIHHILIGYDHILFLLCLLLPSVLRRGAAGWEPVTRFREAIGPMVATVTMFTLGHSITLALASLGWVSLPPSLIEPAIALTIVVAAIDNLRPVLNRRRRLFTFLFGLIHGFGFAGVLAEMALPTGSFAAALLEFNLGVEAGQLVIVSIALTALLALRRWRGYAPVLLRGGSMLAIGVAALWFVERVFDLKLLPI